VLFLLLLFIVICTKLPVELTVGFFFKTKRKREEVKRGQKEDQEVEQNNKYISLIQYQKEDELDATQQYIMLTVMTSDANMKIQRRKIHGGRKHCQHEDGYDYVAASCGTQYCRAHGGGK